MSENKIPQVEDKSLAVSDPFRSIPAVGAMRPTVSLGENGETVVHVPVTVDRAGQRKFFKLARGLDESILEDAAQVIPERMAEVERLRSDVAKLHGSKGPLTGEMVVAAADRACEARDKRLERKGLPKMSPEERTAYKTEASQRFLERQADAAAVGASWAAKVAGKAALAKLISERYGRSPAEKAARKLESK